MLQPDNWSDIHDTVNRKEGNMNPSFLSCYRTMLIY